MEHNIPLMRKVYEHVTKYPSSLDLGNWAYCIAGHAVRLNGEHGILRMKGFQDGIHAMDFRTGVIHNTDELAARLLGIADDEAEFLFVKASEPADVVRWLEDTLVHADMREFDLIAAGFQEDEWPIGRVIG